MKKSSVKKQKNKLIDPSYYKPMAMKALFAKIIVFICLVWLFFYVGLLFFSFKYTLLTLETNNQMAMNSGATVRVSDMASLPANHDLAYISIADGEDYFDLEHNTYLKAAHFSFFWDWLMANKFYLGFPIALVGMALAFVNKYSKTVKFFFIIGFVTLFIELGIIAMCITV